MLARHMNSVVNMRSAASAFSTAAATAVSASSSSSSSSAPLSPFVSQFTASSKSSLQQPVQIGSLRLPKSSQRLARWHKPLLYSNATYRNRSATYQHAYRVGREFHRRAALNISRVGTLGAAFDLVWNRNGNRVAFRRGLLAQTEHFSYTMQALQRMTGRKWFANIQISSWPSQRYEGFGNILIFNRYAKEPYFVPFMACLHYAFSKGSPSILIDFMAKYMTHAQSHSQFLDFLKAAARYWLCQQDGKRIPATSLVQGFKVEVAGRIDGREIAEVWRVIYGSIPAASHMATIKEEYAQVWTRFGTLGVNIKMFLRNPQAIPGGLPVPKTEYSLSQNVLKGLDADAKLPPLGKSV